jgi:fibronectin-binding protein 1
MKVRLMTAARATAGTMLLGVTVAACTGGSASSTPSIFTPSPSVTSTSTGTATKTPTIGGGGGASTGKATSAASGRATATDKPSDKPTATPRASSSARATPRATAKATPTSHPATTAPAHTPVPSATRFPNGAPQTGGGGTAGLQDGTLFGAGAVAILAGLGSLTYRRRVRRKHRADAAADLADDQPARTGIR